MHPPHFPSLVSSVILFFSPTNSDQYHKFVKPSYEKFVEPTKRFSDVIIPNVGDSVNRVACDVLAQHIRLQFEIRKGKNEHEL